ncbi:hypothetical protein ABIA58_005741 [Pseudomonas frederiksbergensis]
MWRGSLLPLGCEAAPNPAVTVFQVHRMLRFCDCCAAEREQAPSPQMPYSLDQYQAGGSRLSSTRFTASSPSITTD